MADEKKGITVKIDADLHAEVREYIEQHGMTMKPKPYRWEVSHNEHKNGKY